MTASAASFPVPESPSAPPASKPNAWAIMAPVQGQIRFGMALSVGAALASLAAMAALAWTLHALMQAPGQWPWPPMLAAVLFTALSYALRLNSFNQTHYAAFRLERVLRTQLSEHLAQVPLGYVQAQGAGALSKVIHDDVKELHVFVADGTPLYARAYAAPLATLAALLWLDWRPWACWPAALACSAWPCATARRWRACTTAPANG